MEIIQIPCLQDNYAYLCRDTATGLVAVIDPSVAAPVEAVLSQKKWPLNFVLNTHHHWDHVGGNIGLKAKYQCEVVGFEGDRARIPGLTQVVREGSQFKLGEAEASVITIPGHTTGHIAYHFEKEKALFCGDTLFLMGCGRLFEGTALQMYESLGKLAALDDQTLVYCGHEYSAANSKFALALEPTNEDLKERASEVADRRRKNLSTVPGTMGLEKKTNPFLRVTSSEIRANLRLNSQTPAVEVFTQLRRQKDDF